MNYLDYVRNQPIMIARFGSRMPTLNPKDKNSIKAWQDWAVTNGLMTREQVNTGYGIYGPKTKAAYAKAQQNQGKGQGQSRLVSLGRRHSSEMPKINPNDPNSVKAWQDWAVANGHMTQAQVNTGYGIYGPKTKAAYAKVSGNTASTSPNSRTSSTSRSRSGVMPKLNPNDPNSVKAWQDWAVANGHMTQAQVNTGYGVYGPKTKAAYAKISGSQASGAASSAPASRKPNTSTSRQDLPSFEQYMYNTGAIGGQAKNGWSSFWGRVSNATDEVGTAVGSFLGIDTTMNEGAKRQAVANLGNRNKPSDVAIHYDTDARYGNSGGIGGDLKNSSLSIGDMISHPARYTIGQNNYTSVEGGPGTYVYEDGSFTVNDPTNYHMITVVNPDGTTKNVSTVGMTPEQRKAVSGSVFTDVKNVVTGNINPMTALENIGSRLDIGGSNRSGHVSADDMARYRAEYEAFLKDPKAQEAYFKEVERYGLKR